jgi:hypothetical protein
VREQLFMLTLGASMALASSASALPFRTFTIDKELARRVCGNVQTSNGHWGCNYCNQLGCYDIDCVDGASTMCTVVTAKKRVTGTINIEPNLGKKTAKP